LCWWGSGSLWVARSEECGMCVDCVYEREREWKQRAKVFIKSPSASSFSG